jgi:hypothetical protein
LALHLAAAQIYFEFVMGADSVVLKIFPADVSGTSTSGATYTILKHTELINASISFRNHPLQLFVLAVISS